MNQNNIFKNGEGDAWYKRNKTHIESNDNNQHIDIQYIINTLNPFKDGIENILEIGCSSGKKLEAVTRNFSAQGAGIDPSEDAILFGKENNLFKGVNLIHGSGDNLPFEDHSFNLVIFGFCLYLFDRTTLLKSLAEADRVLKPGGFLAITDFDPGIPHKRSYAHFDGIYSYKQDYGSFYTKSELYYLLGKKSFSHRFDFFDENFDERVSTQILYKEIDPLITRI